MQQSRRVGWVMNCTESVAALVCIATWTASRPPSFTSPSSHAGPPPNLPSPTAQEAALLRHQDSVHGRAHLGLHFCGVGGPRAAHVLRAYAAGMNMCGPAFINAEGEHHTGHLLDPACGCERVTCRSCSSCSCSRYEHVWGMLRSHATHCSCSHAPGIGQVSGRCGPSLISMGRPRAVHIFCGHALEISICTGVVGTL